MIIIMDARPFVFNGVTVPLAAVKAKPEKQPLKSMPLTSPANLGLGSSIL